MQNTKYQTETVKKIAGTVTGRYTDSVELDSNFDYCDGVQVIEITNGGVPFYSVGIEDKNNSYHNLTHKADWINGQDTPINNRYKEIFIPVIRGDKLDIKTALDTVPVIDVEYQIIFRMRKKPSGK